MDSVEYRLFAAGSVLDILIEQRPEVMEQYCREHGRTKAQIKKSVGFLLDFASWWHYSDHAGTMEEVASKI